MYVIWLGPVQLSAFSFKVLCTTWLKTNVGISVHFVMVIRTQHLLSVILDVGYSQVPS